MQFDRFINAQWWRYVILVVMMTVSSSVAFAEKNSLPKSGTATFISSWAAATAEVNDLGEGYVVEAGLYWGTSTNNEEKGFLHKAVWKCVGSSIGFNENFVQHEYCVVTDSEGDKLYGPANGTVSPETGLVGEMVYEHGTGKYKGIKGAHQFTCLRVGTDNQAFCETKAKWSFAN